MKKILFLFGTRPEAIKMAPLIQTFSDDSNFEVKIAVSGQHREMLDQVLDFFSIHVDYDLNVMKPNQTLHQLTSDLVSRITDQILLKESFDFVFVQGDTTTVLAGAMAAFYQKIKVVHIEAGLRSFDMHAPFPEEMNRVLTSKLSDVHFCPTTSSAENLKRESIIKNVFVVGNTVIDALLMGLKKLTHQTQQTLFYEKNKMINFSKKIILVTCHRRENFGTPYHEICDALMTLSNRYATDIQIVYPLHLNPNIQKMAFDHLKSANIHLIDALDYPELIWMMDKSYFILTDSGGIQEEAPSLGKPVLVMRNVTERMEGIEAGNAVLVGSNKNKILSESEKLLQDKSYYNSFSKQSNPYGDGNASLKIKEIMSQFE